MKPNKVPRERLTATLHVQDDRGLHCRVSALLAYRLRIEAPDAEVRLRTLERREADPKMPLQTIEVGARHSCVIEVEATGGDAAKAIEVVRSVVEREPLSREEVIGAIPEEVDGDIGEIRADQHRHIEKVEVEQWKAPGGWLYELIGPEQLGYVSDEPVD